MGKYEVSYGNVYTYMYDGPIEVFDSVKESRWRATTKATSKKEARRNFEFRAKKKLGLLPSSRVKLPNEIQMIS